MPYRNSAIGGGGKLIVPSLQSPDFAFDSGANTYKITGWSIQKTPSQIYSKTVVAEAVYVPNLNQIVSGGGGKKYAIDQAELTAWNDPQLYGQKTSAATATIAALATTTTAVTGTRIRVNVPNFGAESRSFRSWAITMVCDFQSNGTAPTGTAVGQLRVKSMSDASFTTLPSPSCIYTSKLANERSTVPQTYLIGQDDVNYPTWNWAPTAGDLYFDIEVGALCTVAGEYRINTTHTGLTLMPSPVGIKYSIL